MTRVAKSHCFLRGMARIPGTGPGPWDNAAISAEFFRKIKRRSAISWDLSQSVTEHSDDLACRAVPDRQRQEKKREPDSGSVYWSGCPRIISLPSPTVISLSSNMRGRESSHANRLLLLCSTSAKV
eukprot:1348873-Amorphochlora_amoeboformis.AAC.1